MFENEKAKFILSIYKLKEKSIKNEKRDLLEELTNNIKINFNELTNSVLINSRSEMELMLNQKTTYPAFLWQRKLSSIFNITSLLLGAIDHRYDDLNNNLEFQYQRENIEQIANLQIELDMLMNYRKKVIEDFEEFVIDDNERDIINIIKRVYKTVPSYKSFDKLFDNMKNSHYQLQLQGLNIQSYMYGYNYSLNFYIEELLCNYEELLGNYYKKKNKIINGEDYVRKLIKE